jgi:NAD(P)-dependent dehydrogenase (short-subunit alcohol dehydrogenase family)
MNKLSIASFTNLGYLLHSRDFVPLEADMTGKTVVVTGASGGLGLEVSQRLAELGARVVMVARDREKLDDARGTVNGLTAVEIADLSLLSEVRDLARRLIESEPHVHVLVNNVGVLLPQREVTAEGLEKTLAINLAGQFLLTNLLVPRLLESAPARVISVSSGGMYSEKIETGDVQFAQGDYTGTAAYARTKRGQVILTEMWAERFPSHQIVFHSMHPGWAATSGLEQSLPTFNKLMTPLLRTRAQGADTIVWLAAAPEPATHSGGFWFDRRPAPTHMVESTKENMSDRARLWDALVQMTGSDVPVG